jgi:ATP-dependent Clp protease protease subunit
MNKKSEYMVPMIVEKTRNGERAYDIYSRLLEDRIIFLGTGIDDGVANVIVAQLLFLQMADADKDINFYINSGGGLITAGLAIYDTMQLVKPKINTYCIGQAASMAAVLLAAGSKGCRYALPSSRIMIHSPSGGFQGSIEDISVQVKEIEFLKGHLYNILSAHTGKPIEQLTKDCERDNFMTPEAAKEYGIVDEVVKLVRK